MTLLPIPINLRPFSLGLIVLLAGSCFELHDCGTREDTCDGDSDCNSGFICEEDETDFLSGKSCLPATECTKASDCPAGNVCQQRPATPGSNPFEADSPGKKICLCVNATCDGAGGANGSGGAGGMTSTGGAGGMTTNTGGNGTGGQPMDGGTEGGP